MHPATDCLFKGWVCHLPARRAPAQLGTARRKLRALHPPKPSPYPSYFWRASGQREVGDAVRWCTPARSSCSRAVLFPYVRDVRPAVSCLFLINIRRCFCVGPRKKRGLHQINTFGNNKQGGENSACGTYTFYTLHLQTPME